MAKYRYSNVLAASSRLTCHADLLHQRFDGINFAPFLRWLIDIAPADLLEVLATEFSLTVYEGWGLATSPEKKRVMLKASVALHRSKGTPASIQAILGILGFGPVQIIDRLHEAQYDGQPAYDDTYFHGANRLWAYYRVRFLGRPITNTQASMIRRVLESFAPAHAVLLSLEYTQVAISYNGETGHGSEYNYGSIKGVGNG